LGENGDRECAGREEQQQQKRQMLFPISLVPFEQIKGWKLFDADTGIDSAREIREYFIPDFRTGRTATRTQRRSSDCSAILNRSQAKRRRRNPRLNVVPPAASFPPASHSAFG
jgi:hypothetical protein